VLLATMHYKWYLSAPSIISMCLKLLDSSLQCFYCNNWCSTQWFLAHCPVSYTIHTLALDAKRHAQSLPDP
jgi:hypothetical protein